MPFKPGQSGNPAGRPPKHDKVALAIRAAALKLSSITPAENLRLHAHDVLRMVYTDAGAPIEVRLQCALAALPFEKPRLTAAAIQIRNDDNLATRMKRAQARVEAGDVIDGLVDPPDEVDALAAEFPPALDEDGKVIRLEDLI
jgi:hypothetical protein